nr:hypothetical protein HmN_000921100 [Hymenolepis microstoma]
MSGSVEPLLVSSEPDEMLSALVRNTKTDQVARANAYRNVQALTKGFLLYVIDVGGSSKTGLQSLVYLVTLAVVDGSWDLNRDCAWRK